MISKFFHIKKLKGTIILFLFLLSGFISNSQKYILKIIPDKSTPEIENIIKKTLKKDRMFDTSTLKKETGKIKNAFIANGFISASFDSIKTDSVNIKAYLFTGKKYIINSFTIKNAPYINEKISKKIKKNTALNNIFDLYDNIISEYENNGYPFASIIPEKITFTDEKADITVSVDKNRQIKINKIIIKGDAAISPFFIKKYLSLNENRKYDESKISSVSRKIQNLSFIEEIKPCETDFYNDKADIYLYLKNKKSNSVNGIFGLLTDKNNETGITFTGDVNLKLINNFRKAETLSLNWLKTDKFSQKLRTEINFPFIFKSPFGINALFSLDKRDSTFMKINQKAGIIITTGNGDKIMPFAEKKRSLLLSSTADTSIFKNSENLLFGFIYNSRKLDYVLNPSKGYTVNASLSSGNRLVDGEKIRSGEANLSLDFYFSVSGRFVIKTSSITKYAFPDNNLYENELFDLGGFSSLRGFDENRFRTPAYSLLQNEIRYLYEKNSAIFVFFDFAGMKLNENIIYPYGFGIGNNLNTKAGIISISYAAGKLPGENFSLGNSKIHIGYVNKF